MCTLVDHLPLSSEDEQLDENISKLVFSIRTLIFESVISQILSNKTTPEKILRKAVACTNAEGIEQLLPTGRLEDWKEINPTINYVIYLCESYSLSKKKQNIIKYTSTAITYLIGNAADKKLWRIIADMITDDCQTDRDALGWIIRVLDAFVVYISTFNRADQFEEDLLIQAISIGLHTILVELRSSPENASNPQLQIVDTAYLLSYFIDIGSEHTIEQQQVNDAIKREYTIHPNFHLFYIDY